jgi:AmiR/NasT family two-component response regulator
VREAACPGVIALLSAKDPVYVREAAKRGVFAYIVGAHSVHRELLLTLLDDH